MRGPIGLGLAVMALLLGMASPGNAVAVNWRIAGDGSNALYESVQCGKADAGCTLTGTPQVLRGQLRADADGSRFRRVRGTLVLGNDERLVVTDGRIDLAGDGGGVIGTLMTTSHGVFTFRREGFHSDLPVPEGANPDPLLRLLGLAAPDSGGNHFALVLQVRVVPAVAMLRRVPEASVGLLLLFASLLRATQRQPQAAV